MTDGPWSHWVAEPTVEAEPVDELESARRFAVALENRLAEVRALHHSVGGWCLTCVVPWPCMTVRLIDQELTA